MARPVKPLDITDQEREELKRWLRRHQMPAAEQLRARIILLCTTGIAGHENWQANRRDC